MVSSTCLKEKLVVYIKDMNIYCEVCGCSIKKSNWGKHLKTTKHGIACGEIVVEEVEKKQCCKCRGHKVLEMFSGENATCNGCLAHRKKWADNNPEKVKELSWKYGEEHKEEKKVYNQEYNQREVDCEVCRCRDCLKALNYQLSKTFQVQICIVLYLRFGFRAAEPGENGICSGFPRGTKKKSSSWDF